MSYSNGPRIVTNGLVLYLDAGSTKSYPGSGTVWTDLSGNNNNGTLTNGPTYSSANKGAIVFDGTNDYAEINYNANLGTNFTICAWAYPAANGTTSAGSDIFGKYYSSGQPYATMGMEYYGNKFRFYASSIGSNFVDAGGTSTTQVTALTYPINNWYYLCLSYSSRSWVGYINGNSVVSGTNSNDPYWNTEKFWIGSWKGNPTADNSFSGRVAGASIYTRGLSNSEILQNYNATKGRYNL